MDDMERQVERDSCRRKELRESEERNSLEVQKKHWMFMKI